MSFCKISVWSVWNSEFPKRLCIYYRFACECSVKSEKVHRSGFWLQRPVSIALNCSRRLSSCLALRQIVCPFCSAFVSYSSCVLLKMELCPPCFCLLSEGVNGTEAYHYISHPINYTNSYDEQANMACFFSTSPKYFQPQWGHFCGWFLVSLVFLLSYFIYFHCDICT